MIKNRKRFWLLFMIIFSIVLIFYFWKRSQPVGIEEIAIEKLVVHFIDVGQGDAILLRGPDFSIMVDAGRHDRNEVLPYLLAQNVSYLDLLVGTHPHADHIGQFPQILENFEVGEVWMSGDVHTTRAFERAIDAILATDAKYREPRAGDEFTFGSARVNVVHPKETAGNLNNGSLVLRLSYGDISFLFAGDAEIQAEHEMITRAENLQAQILKIGHHGSQTSSTYEFLNEVRPEVAIYSAGRSNPYNHPHPDVINRLRAMGISVYGTDRNGTILVETDGEKFEVYPEIRNLPGAENYESKSSN